MRNNPLLRPSLILLLNFLLIFMASGQDKIGIIDFDLIKTRVAQTYQLDTTFSEVSSSLEEVAEAGFETFQEEYKKIVERIGDMAPNQAAAAEELLKAKQQKLVELENFLVAGLPEKRRAFDQALGNLVKQFLADFGPKNQYQLILFHTEVAFAATGTNITEMVAPEIIKMKALIEVVRQWKVELLALRDQYADLSLGDD